MIKILLLSVVSLFAAGIIPVKNFDQFQAAVLHPENDTLYVVNFWATWCKPCVAEMPFFEEELSKIGDKPVKILLASLDFKSQMDRLEKFRAEHNLKNEVFLLDAGNPNEWIDKIYRHWGGAIPATVFYRSGKMVYFHDGEFTGPQLDSTITAQLKIK